MKNKMISAPSKGFLPVLALLLLILVVPAFTQEKGRKDPNNVSILVTAAPTSDRSRAIIDNLQPTDFAVLENKKDQTIVDVRKVSATPINIAVVIQDDLVMHVNNEIPEIREFIKSLPAGSKIMTAHISGGNMQVRQQFTTDMEMAAASFRILASSISVAGSTPYYGLNEVLKQFGSLKEGPNVVLFISDGLDASGGIRFGSPYSSLSLDRAIATAQREKVAVFTFYAPSVAYTSFSRLAVNYGQGSLLRLADETGGAAFFSGMDFVTFSPYFRELNDLLRHQWLITYRSSSNGKGFRNIEVTTDFDVNLLHQRGYTVK